MVLTISAILYGLGYVLLGQIDAAWQLFVIFGLFLAIGMSTHDVVTLSVVARWFEKKRGIMTAVVKVGTALGQMSIPLVMALLIGWVGWRSAVTILGVLAAAILLVAAMLMRNPARPAGAAKDTPLTGMTYAEARGGPLFWRLCAIQALFFPILTTIPLHIVVHGQDMGMTQAIAALLLSFSAGGSIIGRLTVGTMSDRIGGRNAYILCFVPMIVALVLILFIDVPMLLFGAVTLYGFAHGGLFTVVSPTVAEYFGMRAHGAIFGVILFCGTVGGAIGPIVAGWVFDQTGGYTIAFLALVAFAVTGLALVLSLPRRGIVAVA